MVGKYCPYSSKNSSIFDPFDNFNIGNFPEWLAKYPLDKKFPTLNVPEPIVFSRTKIGCTLWQTKNLNPETDLKDINIQYNALHDPHLKGHFLKEQNLKSLRNTGEITEDNNVVCSLKEFNDFRNLLYKYRINELRKEIEKKRELHMQKFAFYQEITKRRIWENYLIKYGNNRCRRLKKEMIRKQKYQINWNRIQQKFQECHKIKEIKQLFLKERNHLRDIIFRERYLRLCEFKNKKLSDFKKYLEEKQTRAKEFKLEMKNQKDTLLKQKIFDTWQKEMKLHEQHLTKHAKDLMLYEKRRLKNIEKRIKKMKRKWKIFQSKFKPKKHKKKSNKREQETQYNSSDYTDDDNYCNVMENYVFTRIPLIIEHLEKTVRKNIKEKFLKEDTESSTPSMTEDGKNSSSEKSVQFSNDEMNSQTAVSTQVNRTDEEIYVRKFKRKLFTDVCIQIAKNFECLSIRKDTFVQKELLKLNKNYLIQAIITSILNKNNMNFDSITRLCVSYFSAKITIAIQNEFIPKTFDDLQRLPCECNSRIMPIIENASYKNAIIYI